MRLNFSNWLKKCGVKEPLSTCMSDNLPHRYWIREGDYGKVKSCLQLMTQSLEQNKIMGNGVHTIDVSGTSLKVSCDMERFGGKKKLRTISDSQ